YTVTQADIDAGSVTNTATATGTPPGTTPPPTSPSSTATVPATPSPALTVAKTAAPTSVTAAGQTITYSFLVTNTGNVTLTNVTVDDSTFSGTGALSALFCPGGGTTIGTLAPAADVTCTATYVTTQADVDAGGVTNIATATGTPPGNTPPPTSPPSTVVVPAPPVPGITVAKSAVPATVGQAGDTVTYNFVVTNTGNVTLTDVTVNDTSFTGTGTLSAITCPSSILAPGLGETCTATYTVTQADADAATISNTATATGTPPGETPPPTAPPSPATVTIPPAPGLSVVKSASPMDAALYTVGQTITYTFVVSNTGNVTLTDVAVDETSFTGTGTLSPLSCAGGGATVASLAPGTQATCTATYVLTQADIDAGEITNVATATGTPPGETPPPTSPPATVTVPTPPAPALTVAKSAAPGTVAKSGQKITYTFLATNTGNVTLTDVTVTDKSFTGTGTLSAISCPGSGTATVASLAPGQTATCTASYTATQADVDAGSISNTATVSGTPPGNTPPITSPPSTATVPTTAVGKLTLVKTAHPVDTNGDGVIDAGDTITWTLLVANVGTATVDHIKVSDPTAGTVTCPATSLAPGQSMTCTAPAHVITADDVAAGGVHNVATATGAGVEGATVTSNQGQASVAVHATPAPPLASTGNDTQQELTLVGLLLGAGCVLSLAGARRRRRG
ncbi:MAG: hypothetical protein QOH52_2595, partial [Pseudonocardiales bacterium]|nr:hypothetical protein [Pseudonocardiales bacterium]